MSTLQRPHRAPGRPLRVVARFGNGRVDLPSAVILSRIQYLIERKLGPAHLFVDPDGNAYVLNAMQATLPVWLNERFADYVGCYARVRRKGEPTMEPTLSGLCDDIAQHLAGLNAPAGRAGCAP